MPLMPTEKLKDFTVLGPCPGCWIWTLQYDQDVVNSYAEIRMAETVTLSGDVDEYPLVDLAGWHEAVESVLRDHLEECSGLREVVAKRS